VKRVQILIPFFPAVAGEAAAEALRRTLAALGDGATLPIALCCAEGAVVAVPPAVRCVPIPPERVRAEADLPPGWLAALTAVPGPEPLVLLDFRLGDDAPERVAACLQALDDSGREVALGVAEAEDHPCQLNFFLDVTASRVCLPVDPEAEAVRRACAPLFPPALPLVVTQPFPFAWREWIPDETADAAPWVLEPGLGAVRCGRALLGHQVLDETGVVLWRETPDTARQVVAALRPWAAVCALAPPDQDDLGVLAADGDMTVVGQGDLVQAFPLAPPQDLQFANAAMALFPLMPGPDGRRQARLPRRQGAFLLQSFIHSRLPETDIELPYIPPDNAWEVSCANLGRRANGACIAGRQAFPAVAVFTGRAMGVSGAARAHVADALARRAFTSFPCPADVAGVLPVPGSPEPGTTPPPPDTPAASPAAETGLAAMARDRHAACCLRFRLEMEQAVIRYAGAPQQLLPYKARAAFVAKQTAGLARDHAADATFRALFGSGREALDRALTATLDGDLPRSWWPEATRRWPHGRDFEDSLRPLDALYAQTPGLGGLYARLARERFMPVWRHGRAVRLFAREQERGWLTAADWLSFATALAMLGRVDEATARIEEAYRRYAFLQNGFADAGWGAFYFRRYDPAATMRMMALDKQRQRLGPHYVSRWATIVASLGDLDAAVAMVREGYERQGRVTDGGFARVGWEYHVALRHDLESVWPYFAMDAKYHNKNAFREYILGAWAATGRLKEAVDEAAYWYKASARARGYYAIIGLMHWRAYGDDAVLRDMLLRDSRQGTATLLFDLLLRRLIETRSWPDTALQAELRDATLGDAAETWPCARQLLCVLGFTEDDIRRLLPGLPETPQDAPCP